MMERGTYTQRKYDDMISAAEAEAFDRDYDDARLLEQLNSSDFFAPFSDRLLRYISKVLDKEDCTRREAYLFLYNKMKTAGINPSINTIKKWLNVKETPEGDVGPKMGDKGREAMFQVAFSLELSVAETEDFFHRVYLDKAFNFRNPREYVYFYCLQRGRSYTEAHDLAEKAERLISADPASDGASATVMIKQAAQTANDDDELLTYIGEHAFNFTRKNETALSTQERLLKDLTGEGGQIGLAAKEYQEYKDYDMQGSEGRNLHSVDFVLDIAVNGHESIEKSKNGPSIKRAREVFSRREISDQFPNANTISHPDSSYILRKNIIFLFFYWFWVKDFLRDYPDGDDETFVTELNTILEACGYSPLYFGNPYDWLFLYCSACKDNGTRPLDVFRGILEEDWEDEE